MAYGLNLIFSWVPKTKKNPSNKPRYCCKFELTSYEIKDWTDSEEGESVCRGLSVEQGDNVEGRGAIFLMPQI